jgi:hypothetical protein
MLLRDAEPREADVPSPGAKNRCGGRFDERPYSDYPTSVHRAPATPRVSRGRDSEERIITWLACERGKENVCAYPRRQCHPQTVIPAKAGTQ